MLYLSLVGEVLLGSSPTENTELTEKMEANNDRSFG